MIYLNDVSKIYPPDVKALNNVHLHIEEGEFVSVVGRAVLAKPLGQTDHCRGSRPKA